MDEVNFINHLEMIQVSENIQILFRRQLFV